MPDGVICQLVVCTRSFGTTGSSRGAVMKSRSVFFTAQRSLNLPMQCYQFV